MLVNLSILSTAVFLMFFVPALIFADSEEEGRMVDTGNLYFQLGDYKKAISYYDQVLEINPNNLDALNNKGAALVKLGKADEAIQYYIKILSIDPNHSTAKSGLKFAIKEVWYVPAEGMLEMIVRNPEGDLVTYLATPKIDILNHQVAQDTVGKWPLKKIIYRDGQEFEIRQKIAEVTIEKDFAYSNFGFPLSYTKDIWVIFSYYYQIPVEEDDEITFIFTIVRPVE